MNDFNPNQLLDRAETAAMLTRLGFKISKQLLAKIACTSGDGPEYRIFLRPGAVPGGQGFGMGGSTGRRPPLFVFRGITEKGMVLATNACPTREI
jgi:hypothetical protein